MQYQKIDAPPSPPALTNSKVTDRTTATALDLLAQLPNLRPPGVLRTTSAVGPSLGMPPLIRSTSANRNSAGGSAAAPAGSLYSNPNEWRSFVAIEERSAVRGKLGDAYRKACPTYHELLELVMCIDEEILFAASPTRLEYFKSAIDWENRLLIKRKQLSGQIGVSGLIASGGDSNGSNKRKANGQPQTPVDTKSNESLSSSAAAASAAAPVPPPTTTTATVTTPLATTPGGHPLTKKLRVATD